MSNKHTQTTHKQHTNTGASPKSLSEETSSCCENRNFIDRSEHNGGFTLKRQNEAAAARTRLAEDDPPSTGCLSSGERAEGACKWPNSNTGEGFYLRTAVAPPAVLQPGPPHLVGATGLHLVGATGRMYSVN